MKSTEFRPASITPLFRFSIWVQCLETTDSYLKEYFHKYWIMDDFGNAVEVRSPLSLWNWNKDLTPSGQHLWH